MYSHHIFNSRNSGRVGGVVLCPSLGLSAEWSENGEADFMLGSQSQ
jgi:hypothetical protein